MDASDCLWVERGRVFLLRVASIFVGKEDRYPAASPTLAKISVIPLPIRSGMWGQLAWDDREGLQRLVEQASLRCLARSVIVRVNDSMPCSSNVMRQRGLCRG